MTALEHRELPLVCDIAVVKVLMEKCCALFADRDTTAEKSFASQDCSGANVSSAVWPHDKLLSAGKLASC